MSFYKEGIEKTPIVGDIEKIEEHIKISKENGCKLLECKTIDDNIALRRENIKLKKEISKYQAKSKEAEAVIEEMAKQIDNLMEKLLSLDENISYEPCNNVETMNVCLEEICLDCIKEYFRNKAKEKKE